MMYRTVDPRGPEVKMSTSAIYLVRFPNEQALTTQQDKFESHLEARPEVLVQGGASSTASSHQAIPVLHHQVRVHRHQ